MEPNPVPMRTALRHPLPVRIATLTLAIGSLAALVVNSSLSTGCNRSGTKQADEETGADDRPPRAKGEEGYMGAPKSGKVFGSRYDEPSTGAPTSGTASSPTPANSQSSPAQAAPRTEEKQ